MSKTEFEASMDRHLEGAAGPAAEPGPRRTVITDSLSDTLQIVSDLLQSMPRSAQARARVAAHNLEQAFEQARRDAPRDPAVALGTLFALTYLLDQMMTNEREGDDMGGNLIQLLS